MLSEIRLKVGEDVGRPPLSLSLSPGITVFVGPNNSGKSQALREIAEFVRSGSVAATVILERLTFAPLTTSDAKAAIASMVSKPRLGEAVHADHEYIDLSHLQARELVHPESLLNYFINPNDERSRPSYARYYISRHLMSLDGPSRISLVNNQSRGDLKNPTSILARLFTDDPRRAEIRRVIHEATGLYLAIDASVGDQLALRFGSSEPPDERHLGDATLDYMRRSRSVSEVSDGIKAFSGLLIQAFVGNPRILTIDEPEAFLHPSLAFTLGKEIAKSAIAEEKHIFTSTHSAKFLSGLIAAGVPVNIIRLTFDGTAGTARLLPNEEVRAMMQDPLLRSVGVLEGLFYDHVVVGEANADRAFYQEINERLLAKNDERGIPHTLFLNADSKQTVPRIVSALRRAGIPSVGVVDIDVLKEGGTVWSVQLGAAGIPTKEHPAYQQRRLSVLTDLKATGKDFKTEGGIFVLAGSDQEAAANLINDLARYGLFAVPGGEVERWLPALDIARGKQSWLRSIFETMGDDPTQSGYVQPDAGDVWDFVGRIGTWLKDRQRRGMGH